MPAARYPETLIPGDPSPYDLLHRIAAEDPDDDLPQQLRERGDFHRARGRIKDAELMYGAAVEIENLRRVA